MHFLPDSVRIFEKPLSPNRRARGGQLLLVGMWCLLLLCEEIDPLAASASVTNFKRVPWACPLYSSSTETNISKSQSGGAISNRWGLHRPPWLCVAEREPSPRLLAIFRYLERPEDPVGTCTCTVVNTRAPCTRKGTRPEEKSWPMSEKRPFGTYTRTCIL